MQSKQQIKQQKGVLSNFNRRRSNVLTKCKFNNKKITINGITFDSKKEAARYSNLVKLQEKGVIHDLKTQVKFELIPKQKGERSCNYVADFVYKDVKDNLIVEDVKGSKKTLTPVYSIKRKLMLFKHGIKIREVY